MTVVEREIGFEFPKIEELPTHNLSYVELIFKQIEKDLPKTRTIINIIYDEH